MGEYVWGVISALASIIAVIDWIREHRRGSWKERAYPIAILLLTAFSTFQFLENHKIISAQHEASALISTWPNINDLKFHTKGEKMGIALSGLIFLEKHKESFPETYKMAKDLIEVRAKKFESQKDFGENLEESNMLEDVSSTMIQLISSVAKEKIR
jgi:hypothetical protein